MKRLKFLIFATFVLILTDNTFAQQKTEPKFSSRVNILFGLNQPLLVNGFNIEANLFFKRFVFDYSHGASLDFENSILHNEAKSQFLDIHIPYSTGFGIGYQLTNWFNLRVEPKWHKFELYYNNVPQTKSNMITSYNTFTLGLGAYINWQPFKNKGRFLRGFMVSPSIRYWPNISSTLNNDTFEYFNQNTQQQEIHNAMNIGMNNSPIIANISIGYTFDFK